MARKPQASNAPKRNPKPKPAAGAPQTAAPEAAPRPASSAVPFKGEACTYVDAQGKRHSAVVAGMNGGCVADLVLLKNTGNTSVSSVPDKSRANGGHYWTVE